MLFAPKCRPPTCLYSTRSGPPAAAAAQSAAHWRTSASWSPISRADGPRMGTPSGSHSWPAANRASSTPESHFFLIEARTSAGRVHNPGMSAPGRRDEVADLDLLGDLVRGPAGLVLVDRERLQPRVVALRVVHEAHRGHVRLDDVDLLQRGDDQQLQAEPAEQLQREPGRLVGAAAERLIDDREPERP